MQVQVGIDIPSIKATLSDSEYRFVTAVAGANFGEPLRLPPAAEWLEDALMEEHMEDAESGTTPSLQACAAPAVLSFIHFLLCTCAGS